MQVFQQFLPFLRLDGYYILSDLTGVPDLFARIKPTLQSMLPGQEEDKRAHELKPWVRVVVTAWVLALIPILLLIFGIMVFNAPRIFATAWDSFFLHLDKAREASLLGGIGEGVQMALLALPAAGIAASFGRGGKNMLAGAWNWSSDSVLRRGVIMVTTAGLAGLLVFVWWPNGDYRPIQPGEKGTLTGAVQQFSDLDTGRPGLSEDRQEELGGAPFETDAPGVDPEDVDPATPGDPGEEPAEEPGSGPTDTGSTDTGPTATTPSETTTTETTTEPTDTTSETTTTPP
jgi:putative peptide zinc metalloprotease protein